MHQEILLTHLEFGLVMMVTLLHGSGTGWMIMCMTRHTWFAAEGADYYQQERVTIYTDKVIIGDRTYVFGKDQLPNGVTQDLLYNCAWVTTCSATDGIGDHTRLHATSEFNTMQRGVWVYGVQLAQAVCPRSFMVTEKDQ